jgi:hypothetical protein
MELFSDTQQTVVVVQTANGKATAEINVPLPIWEIILKTVMIFVVCSSVSKKFGMYMNNKISKQAKIINLDNIWKTKKILYLNHLNR